MNNTIYGNINDNSRIYKIYKHYHYYNNSLSSDGEKIQAKQEFSKSKVLKESLSLLTVDGILAGRDTSKTNYLKVCNYLQFEIRKNIDKDFPLALEKVNTLQNLAKLKGDSSLIINTYALLFFMYISKDFEEYGMPYGLLLDSLMIINTFDTRYTVETFDLLSKGYFLLGKYTKVIEVENLALKVKYNYLGPINESIAKSHYILGKVQYYNDNNLDSSLLNLKKAVKIVKVIPDNSKLEFVTGLYYHYGLCENEKTNEIESSMDYLKKCVEIAIKKKDTLYLSYAYHTIGYIFKKQSKFDTALTYYHRSLLLKKKAKLKSRKIAYTLRNIGELYSDINQSDSSQKYFSESLQLFEGDTTEIENKMSVMYQLGISCAKKNPQEAIHLLSQASKYYRANLSINDCRINDIYYYLGECYNAIGNFDSAIYYLDSNIKWSAVYNPDFKDIYFSHWERAISYENKYNYRYAVKNIDSAIFYFQHFSIGDKHNYISLLNDKSYFLEKLNLYDSAIKIQDIVLEMIGHDSILSKNYYLNSLYQLANLYFNKKDTVTTKQYLNKCYQFISVNKYIRIYKNLYADLADLSVQTGNIPLALSFYQEEKKNILLNKKLNKLDREDLLFKNECDALKLLAKNDYNDRIQSLELSIRKNDKNYFEKNLSIYLNKIIYFSKEDYKDSMEKIVKTILTFIELNREKMPPKSYEYLSALIKLLNLKNQIENNPTNSYFGEVKKIIARLEKPETNLGIIKLNTNIDYLSLYKEVGDYYWFDAKNYKESIKYYKEVLRYNTDTSNISNIYYSILIVEYENYRKYDYLVSTLNYINSYSKTKKEYVAFIASEFFISEKRYDLAKLYLDPIKIDTTKRYSWGVIYNKLLCYIALGNEKNALDLLEEFMPYYRSKCELLKDEIVFSESKSKKRWNLLLAKCLD